MGFSSVEKIALCHRDDPGLGKAKGEAIIQRARNLLAYYDIKEIIDTEQQIAVTLSDTSRATMLSVEKALGIQSEIKRELQDSQLIVFRPHRKPCSKCGGEPVYLCAVCDEGFNVAEAELTILAIPAGISLYPTTSRTSLGHVGMELTVDGMWFIANAMVTITVATATTNANGNFSAIFTVPPSVAGSHTVTATDGTNSLTSIFTMESEAPLMPVPLLPKVAATAEAETFLIERMLLTPVV